MPRYFFDTSDGELFCRDEEGLYLADSVCARKAALAALPDMARDVIPDGDRRVFRSSVRDERGNVIFKALLTLAAGWVDQPGD